MGCAIYGGCCEDNFTDARCQERLLFMLVPFKMYQVRWNGVVISADMNRINLSYIKECL